ncbi:MAG: VanZ family protein [Bacteroidetes bacterium]|jgi:VanZ family protein|nr:VanZ family protein [Bacteroidota bacterium]
MIRKNIFTILTSLLIFYLSLAGSSTFGYRGFLNIPYIDKIGHFGLYFILMSVIILEHKKAFVNTRQLILVALIPFFFGTLMELFQLILTSDRKGELLDAAANASGIVSSIFIWLMINPYYRIDSLE